MIFSRSLIEGIVRLLININGLLIHEYVEHEEYTDYVEYVDKPKIRKRKGVNKS